MPSNRIEINYGLVYEVPDSWMPPLMTYLDLVKGKLGHLEKMVDQLEAQDIILSELWRSITPDQLPVYLTSNHKVVRDVAKTKMEQYKMEQYKE
jgi:hypothetical protein